MSSRQKWSAAIGFISIFLFALPLCAQKKNDPLNPLEIDQLRDAMLYPDERLKLYVKFTRDRMAKIEEMRANPKTTERGLQTHDMLQDFRHFTRNWTTTSTCMSAARTISASR